MMSELDYCPTCGRYIRTTDSTGRTDDDGQRRCASHEEKKRWWKK